MIYLNENRAAMQKMQVCRRVINMICSLQELTD